MGEAVCADRSCRNAYNGNSHDDERNRIENVVSHPHGYDYYGHYHFEFEDESSQDMSIDESHMTLALMTNKATLVWRFLDVFLDFRMYHLLFEKAA